MALYPFYMLRPVAATDAGTFTRASVGTYFDKNGVLQTAAVDTPRFTHDPVSLLPQGLMIEAAGTNSLRNNGNGGAVVGTPGTMPTNWSADTTLNGLSRQVVATGTEFGMPYIDLRVSGTATAVANFQTFFESAIQIAAAMGQTWSSSLFARIVAGSIPAAGVSIFHRIIESSAGGAYLQEGATSAQIPTSTLQRLTFSYTTQNATCAFVYSGFYWAVASGTVIDVTLRVYAPQLEQAAAPTSVIQTTTVAVTRAADNNTRVMLSSVAETAGTSDPAAWNAATAYVTGGQVSRIVAGGIHNVYQRLAPGGTTATAPESDTVNWVYVGPTNRWKMFDAANETQTTDNDEIQVCLVPGVLADSVVLDNVDADSVRLVVPGTAYDQTVTLKTRACADWYQYYFEPFVYRKTAVFTSLPLVTTNKLNVIARKLTSVAKIGTCLMGLTRQMGYAEPGATVGIIDYSTKSTDQFGSTTVVKRAYSKRMTISVIIQNADLDSIQDLLALYRSTPVAWVGAGNLFSSLVVYGYYRSFDIVIAYPTQSRCNFDIEGLT